MKEVAEFRVDEQFAPMLFSDWEGRRIGDFVRKIELETNDPLFRRVGELQSKLRLHKGKPFFYGWSIVRKYSNHELGASALLHLRVTTAFEPAGEECGTRYDETTACPLCGSGATQASDLRLDLRKAPRSKDIARTIAGEIIISQRMAERMIDAGLTGFELGRVHHKARYEDDAIDLTQVPTGRKLLDKAEAAGAPHPTGRFWVWLNRPENSKLADQARNEYVVQKRQAIRRLGGKPAPIWHQLLVPSSVDIDSLTRTGIDPFDEDAKGEYRCPNSDLIGLNLLSEVSVNSATWNEADIVATNQFIGMKRGLLRPERIILISPRIWQLIESENFKGCKVEVAHVV